MPQVTRSCPRNSKGLATVWLKAMVWGQAASRTCLRKKSTGTPTLSVFGLALDFFRVGFGRAEAAGLRALDVEVDRRRDAVRRGIPFLLLVLLDGVEEKPGRGLPCLGRLVRLLDGPFHALLGVVQVPPAVGDRAGLALPAVLQVDRGT